MATAAFADSISTDGDTLKAGNNISYGLTSSGTARLCSTRGAAVAGDAEINRTGTAPNLTPGESVTLALTSPNAAIVVSGGTAAVPTTWSGGASFTIATSTTVGTGVADGSYTINATATGATSGFVLTDSFTVTVSCTVAPPADTTAPSAAAITIDDGATWTNSATGSVTLDLSGTDNVGITKYRLAESQAGLSTATDVAVSPAQASFSALNIPFTLTGAEAASRSVWLRVYDAAGQSLDASDTIGWDYTAPNVSYTSASGTAGTAPWYTSNVVATFTATDNVSGFGSVGNLTTTNTATSSGEGSAVLVNSPAFTDNAGNTRAAAAATQSFSIDLSNPYNVAFVDGPAAGSSHYFGSVPAAPTCTADDAISGLDSCVVSGYSSAVGSHTMTATATDNAGRTATLQRSYTVLAWTLNGFYSPVDMNALNIVKAGSTVPLKFEIFAGTTELTETSRVDTFQAIKSNCGSGEVIGTDEIEQYTSGSTSLRYDATGGQFIQNWQVPKASATAPAGTCYKVILTTDDGSQLIAYFKTK